MNTSSPTRILIAEDYPSLRAVLTERLRRSGFDAECVGDGADVLQRVLEGAEKGRPFSVVLTDLRMPRMGGVEATRLIRESGFDLPVVWMTGMPTREHADAAAKLGVLHMLCKPFDFLESLELLRRAAEAATRSAVALRA